MIIDLYEDIDLKHTGNLFIEWQCLDNSVTRPETKETHGHTATYDLTEQCIYIFGGSKNSGWFHDVHVYDTDENMDPD